jgi:hypothetical protein
MAALAGSALDALAVSAMVAMAVADVLGVTSMVEDVIRATRECRHHHFCLRSLPSAAAGDFGEIG